MPGGRIQADFLQHADHGLFTLFRRTDVVRHQALGNDLFHGHARAETAERVLKHHLQLTAQRAHQVLAVQAQFLGAEADAAL